MSAHTKEEFEKTWSSHPGFVGWLMEVNNQPLGKRFMITAFIFFLIGGVMALFMRLQLIVPEFDLIGPQRYNELFTMHGSTMMYLFAVPFLEGLALYLLPLIIGSRDVAFPRLTAFSYWCYLFGGLIFFGGIFTSSIPDAGWFAYTPLSGPEYSGLGMDFWLLGLSMVELAGITAGIEIVVTILKLRAPGMTMSRMPIFVWALLLTGGMIVFAFTVLLTGTLMLEMDRALGTMFFNPNAGGNTLLWQHIFWFFGHPDVYIMFLPAAGVVSMIVATFARRPLAAYSLVTAALLITAVVGFGLWVHHMFTTGLPHLAMAFFSAASLMIGIASGIQIFAWMATFWGTKPALKTPFLYVLGFLFVFVLGGLTGVMVAVVPFNIQVHDTYFIVAHLHYVLIGGVLFPIFAAIHYWFPKITGRMLSEGLGKIGFWLIFIGFNVTFFPMHIMGLLGMPRRVYTYLESLQLETYNIVATIGAFLLAFGVLAFLVNIYRGWSNGAKAGDSPWNGETLEWTLSSPPPQYSYRKPPIVRGRHPAWQPERSGESPTPGVTRAVDALEWAPANWRATLATDPMTGEPQSIQNLPGPTIIPLFTALGLAVGMIGVLGELYLLLPLGCLFAVATLFYWLYPRDGRLRTLRQSPIPNKAGLPIYTTEVRSTAWWGMLSLLTVLAMVFATLFFSYFYIRLFSDTWPQDGLSTPEFGIAGIAFPLLLAGGLSHYFGARAFHAIRRPLALSLLAAALGCKSLFVGAFILELKELPFEPTINAYGSLFFTIAWVLLFIVSTAAILSGVALIRLAKTPDWNDGFNKLQMQLTSMFSIFSAGTGIAVFMILYVSVFIT